ncbi:hypothetical protein [Niabella aurantiaca]|uniref:hypothetical protein n=1 Tax=Niabella aurantiaca TaxID=379900 RepID=UPI0003720D01|nr:hypothetical protein [Niabella aurantiaca]
MKTGIFFLKNKLIAICLLGLLLIIASCKKENKKTVNTNINQGRLTLAPVDFEKVSGLVPLGNLNPPGHTFPTKHTYIYFANPGTELNVYAPGAIYIFQIARFRNTTTGFSDYRIEFGNPSGTVLFLGHLSTLHISILEKANGFNDAVCETYSTGGSTVEYCRKPVSIEVDAGDIIATAGATAQSYNIDMGASVNGTPVCPLDFFAASAKNTMEAKAGSVNGDIRRTETPVCGAYNLDIAGTLQGNWYKQGAARDLEDQHIAFVKDNIQPDKLRISIGNAVPGMASGVYGIGIADVSDGGFATGLINRTFATVTPDGQTYCYEPKNIWGGSTTDISILAKMENTATLSFEKRDCDCSCEPYSFSSSRISFNK